MVAVEFVVFPIVLWLAVGGVPAYVIAERRGLAHPWIAFIPLVGFWIILAESTGRRGWIGVAGLIPFVSFILVILFAFDVPVHHGRSRWWTLALLVPGPNIVGYWAYALTLPRPPANVAVAAG